MPTPKFAVYTDWGGQGRDVLYSEHPSEAAAITAIRRYLKVEGFKSWRFWVVETNDRFVSGPFDGAHLPPPKRAVG